MSGDRTARIRALNNTFRRTFSGGKVYMTDGIASLDDATRAKIVTAVKAFDAFTKDNNPWGECDLGTLEVDDNRIMWKIDYYNSDMTAGSEDPSDPAQTTRVMTVMLMDEY